MRHYRACYQTTIGATVYFPPDWADRGDDDRYVTLRHERVHLRQFARFTVPVMALLYLLVPLPMGLSWWRAHFEKQAYAETIAAAAEVWGADCVREPAFRGHIVGQFTGASYGWMWPFRGAVERWYDRQLAEVRA